MTTMISAIFGKCLGLGAQAQTDEAHSSGLHLRVVSWNVAAINNNPFEYWITHSKPEYKKLMESVERYVKTPDLEDVDLPVHTIFTDAMFETLMGKMRAAGMEELDTVEHMWLEDYRKRAVVTGFLSNPDIGRKRLASMPDRVSNTIELVSGEKEFRPAVINCYGGTLDSLDDWFAKWLYFFFEKKVEVSAAGGAVPVHKLLEKIQRSKYPDLTAVEEKASIPLQLVVLGIMDAVLVNMMQTRSGDTWQVLRGEICESMFSRKNSRVLEILSTTYADADLIFLQEAGNLLVELLRGHYSASHHVLLPSGYDAKRSQNSLLILRSSVFAEVEEVAVEPLGWTSGDLLVARARLAASQEEVTIASYHGDTNGRSTLPMLARVVPQKPTHRLILGIDANAYEKESPSTLNVLDFEKSFVDVGLSSVFGKVDPSFHTTFNARTFLQPQFNKAAHSTELLEKGDRNPKDFILFSDHFTADEPARDNTGRLEYVVDMVFPTLEFPSDHAIISANISTDFDSVCVEEAD